LKMKVGVFALALIAAVSAADEPETFKNRCMHCIDEGYVFCSADGSTGTCLDASCAETDAYGTCTLTHTCDTAGANIAMTAYTQCAYTPPAGCPATVTITRAQIDSGGADVKSWEDKPIKVPYE